MSPWLVVVMMIAGGALMSFQAPINAALRGHVGMWEASLISFSVGTLALILVVSLAGKGSLANVRQVSWWHLLGGLIGAVFVTATLIAAPKIGVTGMIVATLAGNMAAGILIDRYGWVGIAPRAIDLPRVAGVFLMILSVILINWSQWRKA
jgi:transporter family-2 protein